MRTFLTYVLAALAVTVVPVATELFWLTENQTGDPSLVAGALSELIVSAVLAFVGALFVVGALWRVVGYVSDVLRLELHGWRNLPRGVFAHLLLSGLLFLPELVFGAEAVGELAARIDGLNMLLTLLVAGSVWGAVFWIRAPKPTTAGIAA